MRAVKTAKTVFILLLAGWLALSVGLVYVLTAGQPVLHAVVGMGAGLIVLWVFLCGGLMLWLRRPISFFVRRIPLAWPLKFVLFAIALAMLEEAVTTGMTNLAPLFGVQVGQAYITASADYLDVILHHSVIVFVPMFIAWAWLLSRWRFSPFQVFLLFGLTGLLAESLTFGTQHLSEFAMWIFVYGLMVYLPACSVPEARAAVQPRWYHFPIAVLLPFLFGIPLGLLLHFVFPNHPDLHFPPIQG